MRLNEVDEFEKVKYSGPQEKLDAVERRLGLINRRMAVARDVIDQYASRHKVFFGSKDPAGLPPGYIVVKGVTGRESVYDLSGMASSQIHRLVQASQTFSKLSDTKNKLKQQVTRYRLETKKASGVYTSQKQLSEWQEVFQKEVAEFLKGHAGSKWDVHSGGYIRTKKNGTTRVDVGFFKADPHSRKDVSVALYTTFQSLIKGLKEKLKMWLLAEGFLVNVRVSFETENDSDHTVTPPRQKLNLHGWFEVRVQTDDIIKRYKK